MSEAAEILSSKLGKKFGHRKLRTYCQQLGLFKGSNQPKLQFVKEKLFQLEHVRFTTDHGVKHWHVKVHVTPTGMLYLEEKIGEMLITAQAS